MLLAKVRHAFISTSFSRVLAGQMVSVTGSNATAVVIPLIAVITLNCSSFEVGILTAAESLAAAIFGIYIGKWCDRIGPDRTMLLSNLIGAAATGILFVILYLNRISFPALVALMLVIGIASLGFDISRTGYTVALVPRERIPHANSLIEGANAVGEGIGPSIGGWLFSTAGAAFSLLFDFVSYLVSSLLVFINVRKNRTEYARYDRRNTMRRTPAKPLTPIPPTLTPMTTSADSDTSSRTGSSGRSRCPRDSSTSSRRPSSRCTTCSSSGTST